MSRGAMMSMNLMVCFFAVNPSKRHLAHRMLIELTSYQRL